MRLLGLNEGENALLSFLVVLIPRVLYSFTVTVDLFFLKFLNCLSKILCCTLYPWLWSDFL